MGTPVKGLSAKNIKPNASNFDFVSVEPIKINQFGLSVAAQMYMRSVAADAVEANSTINQIVATAHVALVGDTISFTSGALSGLEVRVKSIDTNNIYLAEDLSVAPSAADTFNILRSKTPIVDSSGNISIAINGSYAEDTAHVSGDFGLQVLGVRNDTNAVMTNADGDYSPLTTDNTGRLRVDATITEAATAADGGALPAAVKVIGGYDGANVQAIATDVNGELQVDVLTLPGSLRGYAEDTTHVSGDFGAMALAVRNDAGGALAGTDGDYIPLTTDASGNLRTNLVTSLPAGTNNIGDVDVLTEPATVADGGALPAVVKIVGGYDGANAQVLLTDSSGRLAVNINTIPGTFAEDSAHVSGDLGSQVLAVRNDTGAVLAGTDGDYIPLSTDSNGNLRTAVIAALPAGTNNIGDVDVLTLPGSLRGYAEDSAHVSGDFGAMALAVRNDAGTSLVSTDGDYAPLQVDSTGALRVAATVTEAATAADGGALPALTKVVSGYDGANVQVIKTDVNGELQVDVLSVTPSTGRSKVNLIRNDYTSTSVTTGAYVQLVASTSAAINLLDIFDSSGETLVFAVGAAAAEVDQFYISPGGNGRIELAIPAASRLSVKAISATASVGELIINSFS